MSKYKIVYKGWNSSESGANVIKDFVNHTDFYDRAGPHTERSINRLIDLLGRISDKLDINLLEIIEKHELDLDFQQDKES